ncbi:MAG: hypothetical protein ACOYNF_20170, partial [Rhodoferax sp.]
MNRLTQAQIRVGAPCQSSTARGNNPHPTELPLGMERTPRYFETTGVATACPTGCPSDFKISRTICAR